ncbi:P-loop containing nucleoside triphosphate hydrolase protein [Gigaspora rosea]|uniref:P-loop containing nucleoside triphosphate hydrolase protein n=1 Tax=Gigaspora rosea TaxID=44941 RepID=A0A397U0U7_9GLOM|nr:P-loop containing nucleoside triphosphate hydrolase protein [Gigaspora rosea]
MYSRFAYNIRRYRSTISLKTENRHPRRLEHVYALDTFSGLGIREPICKALVKNFNITIPTQCQKALIPPILEGKDVLVRDITGSGKTFGIVLALLNKSRKQKVLASHSPIKKPCITSILVVPSRELGFQIENWIHMLLIDSGLPLKSIIQVVAKTSQQDENRQLDDLKNTPPHILVGTATRLSDLVAEGLLTFSNLKTLALDEADHLLRLPTKHAPLKRIQNRLIHPKPTELLTQKIFEQSRPQLVVSSATLNRALRFYFKDNEYSEDPIFVDMSQGTLSPPAIEHYCLLVSSKEIKNITSADFSDWHNKYNIKSFEERVQDFDDDDDRMLDSVAGAIELENVQSGLIFVNNKINVPAMIERLKQFGVTAKELVTSFITKEIKTESTSGTIFVAPEYTARGIDISSVSHVFILGMPSSSTEYLHMSGRTGRMGRSGKVITIIREGQKRSARSMFSLLNVIPIPYPHVQ